MRACSASRWRPTHSHSAIGALGGCAAALVPTSHHQPPSKGGEDPRAERGVTRRRVLSAGSSGAGSSGVACSAASLRSHAARRLRGRRPPTRPHPARAPAAPGPRPTGGSPHHAPCWMSADRLRWPTRPSAPSRPRDAPGRRTDSPAEPLRHRPHGSTGPPSPRPADVVASGNAYTRRACRAADRTIGESARRSPWPRRGGAPAGRGPSPIRPGARPGGLGQRHGAQRAVHWATSPRTTFSRTIACRKS